MNRSPAGKRATVDAAVAAAANPFKPNLRFSGLCNADGISIAAISRESLARVSEVYVGCCDAATFICAYGGATMGMHASTISVQPHPGGLIRHAEPILATPTLLAKVRGIGCLDWACLEILQHGSNPIDRNKGKIAVVQRCISRTPVTHSAVTQTHTCAARHVQEVNIHVTTTQLMCKAPNGTWCTHATADLLVYTNIHHSPAHQQSAGGTHTHARSARLLHLSRGCTAQMSKATVQQRYFAISKRILITSSALLADPTGTSCCRLAELTGDTALDNAALLRGADSLCQPPAPAVSQQTSAADEPEDSLDPALAMDSLFANIDQITAAEAAAKARAATMTPATTAPAEAPGTSAAAGAYLAPADSKRPFNAGRGSSSAMRGSSSARGGIHSNRQAAAAEAAAGAGKGHKQHGGRASSSSRQAAAAAATPAAANPDREATAGEAAVHQHRGRARNRSEREAEAAAQAPADGNGAVSGEE
ncbi:hypothetical protein COO60DRAFT_1599944 [Scenedesmus sp. NREL 46B-D3]|nr:hypothetical protein COO60DRAFT_1599944 [Scenedesmus sp. NREL 46B-D3]